MNKLHPVKVWCKDGLYLARAPGAPERHYGTGLTSDEAIKNAWVVLADWREFQRHAFGICEDECKRCKRGESRPLRNVDPPASVARELGLVGLEVES